MQKIVQTIILFNLHGTFYKSFNWFDKLIHLRWSFHLAKLASVYATSIEKFSVRSTIMHPANAEFILGLRAPEVLLDPR